MPKIGSTRRDSSGGLKARFEKMTSESQPCSPFLDKIF